MKKNQQHEFALYYPQLSQQTTLTLTDSELVHRISSVLRLSYNDHILLFNDTIHARCLLTEIHKNLIKVTVIQYQKNKIYLPSVILLLPLLKREALENAVYGAVEAGVTTVQLITTEKVQRSWHLKDHERLERIKIAACEQAKHFSVPQLIPPISLSEALETLHDIPVYFADPTGQPLPPIKTDCALLIGPEGDLTSSEKEYLEKKKVLFFKMTPTILRAQTAALVSVALVRSLQ